MGPHGHHIPSNNGQWMTSSIPALLQHAGMGSNVCKQRWEKWPPRASVHSDHSELMPQQGCIHLEGFRLKLSQLELNKSLTA